MEWLTNLSAIVCLELVFYLLVYWPLAPIARAFVFGCLGDLDLFGCLGDLDVWGIWIWLFGGSVSGYWPLAPKTWERGMFVDRHILVACCSHVMWNRHRLGPT